MEPLAEKLRPETLDDVIGQEHIVDKSAPLRQQLSRSYVPNIILSGPPGTGKTTIARLIAKEVGAKFFELSAVTDGVPALRKVITAAQSSQRKNTLFIDEIHRFNKAQQDALLPHIESGLISLIGATTENPGVSVNRAILSRSVVFKLHKLTRNNLEELIQRGTDYLNITIDDDARDYLIEHASRDGRIALNWLERAYFANQEQTNLVINDIETTAPGLVLRYDKGGDWHYNTISAYIKSMRAGNTNDAIEYLASMLSGGEDPIFIARRLVIFASEDVGMADPDALQIATNTLIACQNIGMPECRISLAHATTYCSKAPKDRSSYEAINEAIEKVEREGNKDVPRGLRNQQWHP